MEKYSYIPWETGDVITADKLNKISRVLKEVSEEIANATGSDVESEESSILRQKLDSLIVVSSGLPTTEQYGRIWINTNEEQLEKVLITLDDLISNAKFYTTRTAYDKGAYLVAENRIYRVISSISARENNGWNSIKNKCELFVLIDHINDILHNFETILDHDFAASTQMTTNFLGISNISNINPDGTELINLSDLRIAYNELIRIINSSGASVSSLTITLLETMIQDSNNNINQINEQITDIYGSLGNHTEDISSINNNIATILSSINSLNNNIDTIENNIDSLDDSIDNISGALSSLGNPIVSVSKDTNGLHFIHSINELEENELETNNSNDTISIDTLLAGAVRYDKQEVLEGDNLNTALTNLGLNDINSLVSGAVKYDLAQNLEDNEKEQARINIGALSNSDITNISDRITQVENAIGNISNAVTDVSSINNDLSISYLNGLPKLIPIQASGGLSFDGGYVDENTNQLYLTLDNTPIEDFNPIQLPSGIGGGGGGGVSGSATLTRITNKTVDCIYQLACELEFNFIARDAENNVIDNDGIGTWYIDGINVVSGITIKQSIPNNFNIGPYLKSGSQTVKLSVSVDTGGQVNSVATISWVVNAVNLYFTWQYDISLIHTSSFIDKWTVYGNIEKNNYMTIDSVNYPLPGTSRSGITLTTTIPKLGHGVHLIERWMTAMIGDTLKPTPKQSHEMIFVEENNNTPIIALGIKDHPDDIKQYDTIKIPIIIYNPASLTANVSLFIDNLPAGTWPKADRTIQYWTYTPAVIGDHVLKIQCGNVSRQIFITVVEADIGLTEEVSSYAFKFKAAEMATNEVVRNWNSNGVTATFSDNFDWINGGLHTEEVGLNKLSQQYLCIKAGTSMTINYNPFNNPTNTGMTFKIIYKVQNCTDYKALIGRCYDESTDIGLKLLAHEAILKSSGTSLSVPYGEDDYLELEFDIYKKETDNSSNFMFAWLDGVITSFRVYEPNDEFNIRNANIVLGSEYCDIYLYMVKSYSIALDRNLHLDNFIMDAPNATLMVNRYNRNNILDEDGDISYEALATQNKDLRVWTYLVDRMTINKDDNISVYNFNQFWKNGGPEYQLYGEGKYKVQGTSSVEYVRGAANTDIKFSVLTDGNGKNLLADGTTDDRFGNNVFLSNKDANNLQVKLFTVTEARTEAGIINTSKELGPEWVPSARDENGQITHYIKALGMKLNEDSCPITYSNTKVNFASCEQVNNMCNAAWYQKYDPYPSLTARDCMEFNIGVQFIKTRIIEQSELDRSDAFLLWNNRDKYYMYSIANMGNSKKNVHVFHDLTNPNEACIEIKDNGNNQMKMTNPDHLTQEQYFSGEGFNGKNNYELRYPDQKNFPTDIKNAWIRLVWWFAELNPNQATNEELPTPETYENYTFRGYNDPRRVPNGDLKRQVLAGTTVTQYAGTYTHDTFNRRMAKLLNECEDYLIMDSLVFHYLYLERHTMVDNVVKNTFWSTNDLIHWDLSKAYDMDTSDGNNNQGQLVFDYGNEYNDWNAALSKYIFNGGDASWFVFVANLYEACQVMYKDREALGCWSATAYHNFLTEQQKKVPERCWNECYWYDYVRTRAFLKQGDWTKFLDGGQKIHQRKHYEYFELLYDASKYRGSLATTSNINFRAYVPSEWTCPVTAANGTILYTNKSTSSNPILTIPNSALVTISLEQNRGWKNDSWRYIQYNNQSGYILANDIGGIEPKSELTIKMYNKMYIEVAAGTQTTNSTQGLQRAGYGQLYVISFPADIDVGGTQVKIHSASMIQSIKGLLNLYPDTCVFSQATRLTELSIGSSAPGYKNLKFKELTLDNNKLLKYLYIQNCSADSGLNLTHCEGLVHLDASNSLFTSYSFADGGALTSAILYQPTGLSLLNLTNLNDNNFIIQDASKLLTLIYDNTPINILSIVNEAQNLVRARILHINWNLDSMTLLNRLSQMGGYDEMYNTINHSVLTGIINLANYTRNKLQLYQSLWPEPDLIINGTNLLPSYTVRFINYDNTNILDKNGQPYIQIIDQGDYPHNPLDDGIPNPTYNDDAYIYEFIGWSNLDGRVYSNRTVTAQYLRHAKSYTVTWWDSPSKQTQLDRQTGILYGELAIFNVRKTKINDDIIDSRYIKDKNNKIAYYNYSLPASNDIEQEEGGLYKIFAGWDKSTGNVTSDLDVFALWDTANISDIEENKKLNELNVAEIYGIIKSRNNYFQAGDTIDIKLGNDFHFDNVEDYVIADEKFFNASLVLCYDGQHYDKLGNLLPKIELFNLSSPSFTLAIDFLFTRVTNGDPVLFACYQTSTNGEIAQGIRLRYSDDSSYKTVMLDWGGTTTIVGNGTNRGTVVIRHRANTNTLTIHSNVCNIPHSSYGDHYQISTIKSTQTFEGYIPNITTVTLGGIKTPEGILDQQASGWIHWCKIWYDDLGDDVATQLVSLPRENLQMEYQGPNVKYASGTTNGIYSHASFCCTHLLHNGIALNSSATNIGGWYATQLRLFCNKRVYNALPIKWRAILYEVNLPGLVGGANEQGTGPNTTIQGSRDYIYIPSYAELTTSTGAAVIQEMGGRYLCSTNLYRRMKFNSYTFNRAQLNSVAQLGTNEASIYRTKNDPTDPNLSIEEQRTNLQDSDLWIYDAVDITSSSSSRYRGRLFLTQDTTDKYGYFGGNYTIDGVRESTIASTVSGEPVYGNDFYILAADGESHWLAPRAYWTRTPSQSSTGTSVASDFYYVTSYGILNGNSQLVDANYSRAYGILVCFSI